MADEHDRVKQTLIEAMSLLSELRLRYAIVGGLAIGVWGVNRSTDDVDMFVELPRERRADIRRALRRRRFRVPAMYEELDRFGVFRSRSKSGVFLDLFQADGPLGEAIVRRARRVRIGRRAVSIAAPEDLAVLKAFSDRNRDLDDLVALLAVMGRKLDVTYVRRWAKRLDQSIGGDDVSSRVERAIRLARK